MKTQFKLLMLEDSEASAKLILYTLKRAGLNFNSKVVSKKKDFTEALKNYLPDIILSDHSMSRFDSIAALKASKDMGMKIPFILVTGESTEEFAVESIKAGANDYILKDRMARLPSAILSALEKYNLENERVEFINEIITNEALFRKAERMAHFGIWEADNVNGTLRWSDETYRMLGYEPGEVPSTVANLLKSVYPDDREYVKDMITQALKHVNSLAINFRVTVKDGSIRYIRSELVIERSEKGFANKITGFNKDITNEIKAAMEREKITTDLVQRNKALEQFAYMVSHNLRAPLANIIGFSEAMNTNKFDRDALEEILGGLSGSVKQLDNVILDLNQILQIKNTINELKEPVVLSTCINEIKSQIKNLIDLTKVTIITDFAALNEMITIRSYLYSILYNLILNSIKFQRAGIAPIIKIKSAVADNKIILKLKDNGMGIDLNKKRDQVFGLYKRFHSQIEGRGVGLYMVKTQVEALQGKISISSEINKGTEFNIEFAA